MANNPYVNRVETADGSTLMDITDTTAEPSSVAAGEVFYSASGARSVGTGALNIIDDTAGAGDTDKAWSADKLTGEFDGVARNRTIDTPASVISFNDGSEFPMSMEIAVTAVQDLHGYDKPWPAGGGKNILPMTITDVKTLNTAGTWDGNTYTNNGVSFVLTVADDGSITKITANGTATANATIVAGSLTFEANVQYTMNGCPTGGGASTYRVYAGSAGSSGYDDGNGATFNYSTTAAHAINCRIYNGYTANNVVFYPMLRLATETDPAFEPYSNICPISGFDSAVVGVYGNNLVTKLITGVNVQSTGAIAVSGSYEISIARVEQGEQYTITNSDNAYVYGFFRQFPDIGSVTYNADRYVESPKSAQTHTFTAPITGYIAIRNTNGKGDTMVTPGETADAFAPIGTTYQISFPSGAGTVYGGTLTVNADGTGTLVVNYIGYVFDGSSDESWSTGGQTYKYALITLPEYKTSASLISDRFAIAEVNTTNDAIGVRLVNNNQLRVRYGLFTSLNEAAVRQYFSENPLTIVYDLAVPVTYTFSAGQVLSVLGKNNVWADCGQILSLDYETNASRIYAAAKGLANTARQETSDLAEGIAIVVDGDTAPKAITSGQYLFIKNHSTLATGGYHATANIASGASVTSSNVSADTDGLVNALKSNIASLVRVGTYSESPFSISNVKEGSLLIAVRSTYFAMYSIGQSSAVPITVSSTSPVSDISVSNETVTITRNGGTSMRVTVIGVS